MGVPGNANALLLKQAAAAGGDQISRSVRFNSSDSAYLSRTPASSSNRKTWTWAGWVKRSALGQIQFLWGNGNASNFNGGSLYFQSNNTLRWEDFATANPSVTVRITTQVFRDVSSWYHIVLRYDTTQATASDRIRFYVNGVQVTSFSSSTDPSLNYDGYINNTGSHSIGRTGLLNALYLDAYLADIHFIDGQALDPTSFGEFDTNGVWQPIDASGLTYGTNGFHLPFSNNSTAAALGTDTSGNGNTWTVNNISVATGAGNDSLVDTPTSYGTDTGVGGEVRGNYATWNPLDKDSDVTLSNGNLDTTQSAAGATKGTVAVATGKWYWEITKTSTGNQNLGIATVSAVPSTYVGGFTSSAGFNSANGDMLVTGSAFGTLNGSTVGTTNNGDVLGLALDLDGGTLKIYRNGTLLTANHFTISNAGNVTPAIGTNVSLSGNDSANFGQRQWAYAAPAGFKALCTTNLPEPTIADGSTVMDVALYTGNGSTQTISGLNFSPDFAWFKVRNNTSHHALYDIVRGATKSLCSSNTNAEATEGGGLSAFTSDGFSLSGDNTIQGSTNANGGTYVAWCWDAGSSTVTNTQGSITSQVRVNASAGFSVVTYTGNDTSGASFGHGLGVAPHMVIVKTRGVVAGWMVWHRSASASNDHFLILNQTNAVSTNSGYFQGVSSTTVTVGGSDNTNSSTSPGLVAYCFASVAGYSAFGSYTGNGSADGPFVFTGMRPRWLLVKRSSGTSGWYIFDSARDSYNAATKSLYPSAPNVEDPGSIGRVDFLSNGFKIVSGPNDPNSTGTWIYYAVAENPFQYARAR